MKLTEVITSPQRTELLKGMIARFEAANPGVKVEVTSLPWGQAFEKLATMVQGGQIPDVVEMPDRWLALYANNDQLESLKPWMDQWPEAKELTDRTIEFGRVVKDTPYMIPYGFYIRAMFWNKKLFKQAGMDAPPATMADFMEASKKISALGGGKTGYCLRGGPGANNGYMMMMANEYGSNEWFDKDGNSMLDKPEAVAGLQFLVDMYKNGYVSKDSVNWGFNEIVAGFYSGSCAMLDQDPDALIAIAEKMPKEDFAVAPMPLGPHDKSFPTLGYAGWAMFAASEHKEEAWKLIAVAVLEPGQPRMVEVRRRHPDPQGGRQGPVLRHRAVQGLVHRAQRSALGADRDADLSRGVRLLRRRALDPGRPGGAARQAHRRRRRRRVGDLSG